MVRPPFLDELESCPWGIDPDPKREYVVALACCGQCKDKKYVHDGHFACSMQADRLVASGWREEARELNSQWEAVLSRCYHTKRPHILMNFTARQPRPGGP